MDDKLNRHISKVQTPNDQVYYIVPEAIKNGSYVINSPTLNADTQFVITSQNQVISGQKDFSTAPRVFVTDHYEAVLTAADIDNGVFMSFDISSATEETVDNIPGYTWNITNAQLTEIADPTTQSVVIEVLIPESAELTHHYIFRRDYAAMAGTTGAAYFFAVDTSSASSTVIGAAMRLRAYKQATQAKLRIENLGEVSATDTGATSVTVTGSGNAVSGASYDASTRKITLTKGVTALTSHQSIKTLDTTATTAQSTNASEAIAGSGKVTLHKVAKTGTYSDLIGTPSLATVATSGSYNDLSNKPTIPTAVGDLSNDRFVRYDTASQGLSSTQKSNARTNIGAGTGNGSVTSVRVQAGTGLSSSQSTAQTGTLDTTISVATGYKLPTSTEWGGKQDKLESGTNIKTINSQTVLGSGNIEINDTGVEVVSTLPTTPEDDTIYFAGSNASSTGGVVELPVPTAADAGKIFKINSTGGVELGASSEGKIVYSHNISMTMSPAAGGDHSSASFTLYSTDSTPMTFSTIKSYLSSRGPLYVAGYAIDKNNGLCLCLLLEGFSRGFTLTSRPVSDFTSTKFTSFYDSDEFSNLNDAVKAI